MIRKLQPATFCNEQYNFNSLSTSNEFGRLLIMFANICNCDISQCENVVCRL